jgi:hypothetical protein
LRGRELKPLSPFFYTNMSDIVLPPNALQSKNIVIPGKQWTDDAIHREFERELRTGYVLEEETEKARVMDAAYEADVARRSGHNQKSSLRLVGVTPGREWFRTKEKYGLEEINSKEFWKYRQRVMPELSVSKV